MEQVIFEKNHQQYFKCRICGKEFTPKGKHLRVVHGLTTEEYYLKYCCEGQEHPNICECGRQKRFLSLSEGYREKCGKCLLDEHHSRIKLPEEERLKRKRANCTKCRDKKLKQREQTDYQCMCCGAYLKSSDGLANHVRRKHGLSIREYNEKYLNLEQYQKKCPHCGEPLELDLDKINIKTKPCKCHGEYKKAALIREEKLKTTFVGDKTLKELITEKTKEKQSEIMIQKIANGEFTPNITNSWCHSRTELIINNMSVKVRSSIEGFFFLMNQNLQYEKIRIPYFDSIKNKRRTYIVDFVDINNKILYEIKPKSLHNDQTNLDKFNAAIEWSDTHGFDFFVVDEQEIVQNFDSSLLNGQPNQEKLERLLRSYKKQWKKQNQLK